MILSLFLVLLLGCEAARAGSVRKARKSTTLGGLVFPRSRNFDAPGRCALCADGGGVCGGGARSHWDRSSTTDETYGAYFVDPPTVLVSGGLVEVAFSFQNVVQEGGVVAVELCTSPTYPELDEDCFRPLQRDPSDNLLSPVVSGYEHLFFLPNRECLEKADLSDPILARFKIEVDNLTASQSVLRWHYQLPENCEPIPDEIFGTLGTWTTHWRDSRCHIPLTDLRKCGEDCPSSGCQGRTYKNCADVVVSDLRSNRSELMVYKDEQGMQSAIPIVSQRSFEVADSGVAPEEDTDYCGTDFLAQVALCQETVVEAPGTKPGYCSSKCILVANDKTSTSNQWCVNNGLCDLSSCVANFWSTACSLPPTVIS